MKEFFSYLIGNFSLPFFAALYFFAILGVIIKLLLHANTRDQNSSNTPQKFSVWFLIKDNRKRILLNVIVIYLTIRFMSYFIDFDPTNKEAWLVGATLVGLGFDKALEKWKEKGSLLKVKRDVQDTNS